MSGYRRADRLSGHVRISVRSSVAGVRSEREPCPDIGPKAYPDIGGRRRLPVSGYRRSSSLHRRGGGLPNRRGLCSTSWCPRRLVYGSGTFGNVRDAAMKVRVCLGCGVPTMNGSRCMDCAKGRGAFAGFRQSPRQRSYDSAAWRTLSRRVREEWVAEHGWWCPGWRVSWHPSRDLTVDHIVALIEGGSPLDRDNLRVLCRSCHGRVSLSLAARRRAARGGGGPT